MSNFAPARHAEMIKTGHLQNDSVYYGQLRAVQAHRAVTCEDTFFLNWTSKVTNCLKYSAKKNQTLVLAAIHSHHDKYRCL